MKEMRPGCESAPEELSFEWSHYRISSTDTEVTTALAVYAINLTEKFEYEIYYIQPQIRLINSTFYPHLRRKKVPFARKSHLGGNRPFFKEVNAKKTGKYDRY